jgi:hypothetical protein
MHSLSGWSTGYRYAVIFGLTYRHAISNVWETFGLNTNIFIVEKFFSTFTSKTTDLVWVILHIADIMPEVVCLDASVIFRLCSSAFSRQSRDRLSVWTRVRGYGSTWQWTRGCWPNSRCCWSSVQHVGFVILSGCLEELELYQNAAAGQFSISYIFNLFAFSHCS